jgi:hypothetical protein
MCHTGGDGGGGGGGAGGGEPSRLQLLGGGLQHLNVQGLQGLPLIDEALNECSTPSAPQAELEAAGGRGGGGLGAISWGCGGGHSWMRQAGNYYLINV